MNKPVKELVKGDKIVLPDGTYGVTGTGTKFTVLNVYVTDSVAAFLDKPTKMGSRSVRWTDPNFLVEMQ